MKCRPTSIEDLELILLLEKDNNTFVHANTKSEHIEMMNNKNIEHLVFTLSSGSIIGFCILAGNEDPNKSIELRRIIVKEKERGFGKAIISFIKEYCFETLKCHRLWLDVFTDNKRAIHVYQSLGFQKEVIMKECVFINHQFKSLMILSILEKEYYSNTKS